MYKVFFNQKPIILTTKLINQSEESPLFFIKYTSKEMLISAMKSKKIKSLYLYHAKEVKLWTFFFKMFKLVEAAGGIVIHGETNAILFIYRNNKWDFPKGRIEKNEAVQEAAIREVEEETGINGLQIERPLPTTFHIFNRNGKYRLKKTYWYEMSTVYQGMLNPQQEEGIERAEWKSPNEISQLFENAYANIQLLWEQSLLYSDSIGNH